MTAGKSAYDKRDCAPDADRGPSSRPQPARGRTGRDGPEVLLLCAHAPLGNGVLQCLDGIGARTHVLSASALNPLRFSRYCRRHVRRVLPASAPERQAFVAFLNDYICCHGIEIIVPDTTDSAGLLSAIKAEIRGAVCFPTSPAPLIDTFLDKWRFAEFLREHGQRGAETTLIASEQDLESAALAALGFPVVVKPLARDGGDGIIFAKSTEEIRAYIGGSRRYSTLPLIAQRFMPGMDMDLNVLAIEGEVVAWTANTRPAGGVLDFTEHPEALDIARAIVSAAGYHGIANFDMRIDLETGTPTVIECNPRPWYTMPASMWHGVNFIQLGVDWAMGRPLPTKNVYDLGPYFSHSQIMKRQLRRRSGLAEVSASNFQAVRQQLRDPIPLIYQKIRRAWRRLGT